MARAIEQGIINSTTKRRKDELTAPKTDLEVKFWLSKMSTLNLAEQDNKQRIIDTFINSIYVYDDKAVINFNCREESETVPLQLSTYVSDLQGLGEPNRTYPKHYGASALFGSCPDKPAS